MTFKSCLASAALMLTAVTGRCFFHSTREDFMKKLLISVALIALAGSALAQDAMKVTTVTPDSLTWKDNPNIPKGGQFAILRGSRQKLAM